METSNKIYGQFASYAEGIAVLREEYLELEREVFKKPSKRDKNHSLLHLEVFDTILVMQIR